jgi:hypothetical protein
MSNDTMLWNAPAPPPRKPRPCEHIWSSGRTESRLTRSYAEHGEWGWECQFLYNSELAYGRRWVTRADALPEAEGKRQELEGDGWQMSS